jgi:protoheme IX farnesyltransferase
LSEQGGVVAAHVSPPYTERPTIFPAKQCALRPGRIYPEHFQECLLQEVGSVETAATTTLSTPEASAPSESTQSAPSRRADTLWNALVECTKPGITRLVTITSLVGFVMGASLRETPILSLLWLALACGVGTALSAAGANAINQFMERARDARMNRTSLRPLPRGRLEPLHVAALGWGLSILGCLVLWALCGAVPALVSAACVVSYIAVYTPLKPVTSLATFVGAIPGALPPLIGWSTVSGTPGLGSLLEWGGLSLFILMTVWQIPHFLAIAWMYREDYAKGGYAVLPLADPSGAWTSVTICLWSAALIPATLLPASVMPEQLGLPYLTVAGLSGVVVLWLSVRLFVTRGRREARQVFFASIMHLPLLLLAMVAETLIRAYFV